MGDRRGLRAVGGECGDDLSRVGNMGTVAIRASGRSASDESRGGSGSDSRAHDDCLLDCRGWVIDDGGYLDIKVRAKRLTEGCFCCVGMIEGVENEWNSARGAKDDKDRMGEERKERRGRMRME